MERNLFAAIITGHEKLWLWEDNPANEQWDLSVANLMPSA